MGKCDLRIGYSEGLFYGGHIGYTIDENFVKIVENIKDKNYYPIFIKDEMNNNKDFYCFDLNLYEKKRKCR